MPGPPRPWRPAVWAGGNLLPGLPLTRLESSNEIFELAGCNACSRRRVQPEPGESLTLSFGEPIVVGRRHEADVLEIVQDGEAVSAPQHDSLCQEPEPGAIECRSGDDLRFRLPLGVGPVELLRQREYRRHISRAAYLGRHEALGSEVEGKPARVPPLEFLLPGFGQASALEPLCVFDPVRSALNVPPTRGPSRRCPVRRSMAVTVVVVFVMRQEKLVGTNGSG